MQFLTRSQDGDHVTLVAGEAEFNFRPLGKNALLVTITGSDNGQFGTACLDEIRLAVLRAGRLELLIDASQATNVSVDVSKAWTGFFSSAREQLSRVSVLTGSKLIHLTVGIAQHLSQTGNLIQIYSDRALFDVAVARSATSAARGSIKSR